MNIFQAVKQSVTTRQAAERYGIRVGRNGMAVCPFHRDRNPSMKVDRRFHCFGCQADGDVIDFVSRLNGVGLREAALVLIQDFSIPYENSIQLQYRNSYKPRQETEEQRFKRLERQYFSVMSDYYHLLRHWKTQYAPRQPDEDWNPLFAEALQRESYMGYLLDILLFGTLYDRVSLMTEYGKEVRKLERRMAELASGDAPGSDRNGRHGRAAPECIGSEGVTGEYRERRSTKQS